MYPLKPRSNVSKLDSHESVVNCTLQISENPSPDLAVSPRKLSSFLLRESQANDIDIYVLAPTA